MVVVLFFGKLIIVPVVFVNPFARFTLSVDPKDGIGAGFGKLVLRSTLLWANVFNVINTAHERVISVQICFISLGLN